MVVVGCAASPCFVLIVYLFQNYGRKVTFVYNETQKENSVIISPTKDDSRK